MIQLNIKTDLGERSIPIEYISKMETETELRQLRITPIQGKLRETDVLLYGLEATSFNGVFLIRQLKNIETV